jgi:hypothetical protein
MNAVDVDREYHRPFSLREEKRHADMTWSSAFAGNSDLLSATILQHATLLGLKLEGAVPLAHPGFFSFLHGKRELWIFRGLPPFAPGLT